MVGGRGLMAAGEKWKKIVSPSFKIFSLKPALPERGRAVGSAATADSRG